MENNLEDTVTFSSENSRNVMQLYASLNAHTERCLLLSLNEMLTLLEQIDELRAAMKVAEEKEQTAEEKAQAAQEKVQHYEHQYGKLRKQLKSMKAQLSRCRAEIKDVRRQIVALKEVIFLRVDNDELVRRSQTFNEVQESVIEQIPPESRKQPSFLHKPDLARLNSKPVLRRLFLKEAENDCTLECDSSRLNTLDALNEHHERERRARNHTVGLRGKRSISAHAHPATERTARTSDAASTETAVNENEETRDSPPLTKRSKERSKKIAATTTMTIDPIMKKPSEDCVTIRRDISTDDMIGNQGKTLASAPRAPFVPKTANILELSLRAGCEPWTRVEAVSRRRHNFHPLTECFKITSCDVCSRGICFASKTAYKCWDCLQFTHASCSSDLIVPCIPRTRILRPISNRRGPQFYHLKEFCPPLPPMIAYPVIYCIVDLENRGLCRKGLYRVPGRKEHVQSVLNEVRTSRGIPKLSIQEMEVVADVVKTFLRELSDSLVPNLSRAEFIRAAQTNDIMSLNAAVCGLPQPNRDTLSYLMLHLQKVEALKMVNKMSFENIARCMAIPIMGQVANRSEGTHVASIDTTEKEKSVLQMLKMSSEYWLQFLEHEAFRRENVYAGCSSVTSNAPVGKQCVFNRED